MTCFNIPEKKKERCIVVQKKAFHAELDITLAVKKIGIQNP